MSALSNFNDMVNNALDPIFQNPVLSSAIKLFLVLYGGLAAPKLPVKLAPLFANSYFRMAVMTMIIWIANKDPAIALLVAVGYFLSMSYLVKNSVAQVQQTGVVTPEIAVVISGGSGPSIKPSSVVNAESSLMQQSVNSSKEKGYVVTPEAVMSGPVSTAANAGVPVIPSGNAADDPSMMAHGGGNVPSAFVPDGVHDLASIAN